MALSPQPRTHGRTVMLIVLAVLLLTVCAGVYLYVAQQKGIGSAGVSYGGAEADVAAREARRLVTLLVILMIAALLILLFVVGAYLVISFGRMVSRDRVGGEATQYVDAWQRYRLSDEAISAATREPEGNPPGATETHDGPDGPSEDE